MTFAGIHSAICYYCENGVPRPLTAQEELLKTLYSDTEDGSIEKAVKRTKKKSGIMDMLANTFMAIGFGKKKKEDDIDEENIQYPTIEEESSTSIAKRKRREPIFQFNKDKKE